MAHETELTPVVVTANPTIDRVRIDGFSSTSAVIAESQLHDRNESIRLPTMETLRSCAASGR
ncbi:hypothetical protein [Nitrosospira multiformis]|uniref:hypothetical protein n=1 Tax=Nitrosospira multiformis TaxID=1231 RepID=UPI0009440124|nr:hypothetical protein [Nitrosospira multiformis]